MWRVSLRSPFCLHQNEVARYLSDTLDHRKVNQPTVLFSVGRVLAALACDASCIGRGRCFPLDVQAGGSLDARVHERQKSAARLQLFRGESRLLSRGETWRKVLAARARLTPRYFADLLSVSRGRFLSLFTRLECARY